MSDTAIISLTDRMRDAIDRGMPVLLLPPDYPEDKLLAFFIDVAIKGSQDRVLIMPTENEPA